ncbi:Uncharacterised protein [Mycobacteroides abscessus subsp. abscessus]|nr:Uncharacterised protein [Mycobacteroides abscessus subsp. abscessus]
MTSSKSADVFLRSPMIRSRSSRYHSPSLLMSSRSKMRHLRSTGMTTSSRCDCGS